MLIHPKALLATARACAEEATRYALDRIRVYRHRQEGDKANPVVASVATNGKWLFATSRAEPDPSELPDGARIKQDPKIDAEQLVAPKTVASVAKHAGKKTFIDARRFLSVSEEGMSAVEAWPDGSDQPTYMANQPSTAPYFPPLGNVIEKISEETHICVRFDAAYMKEICQAFLDMAPTAAERKAGKADFEGVAINLFFSKKDPAYKQMTLTADQLTDGLRATAILMPITGDVNYNGGARL